MVHLYSCRHHSWKHLHLFLDLMSPDFVDWSNSCLWFLWNSFRTDLQWILHLAIDTCDFTKYQHSFYSMKTYLLRFHCLLKLAVLTCGNVCLTRVLIHPRRLSVSVSSFFSAPFFFDMFIGVSEVQKFNLWSTLHQR